MPFSLLLLLVEGVGDAALLDYFLDTNTRACWECFQKQKEASPIFERGKAWVMLTMLLSSKPLKLIGYKLGIYVPGKLPDDIESDVQAELKRLEDEYLK